MRQCGDDNEDRHFGNFGVLRDNRSGKITGAAPIIDNDIRRMLSRCPEGKGFGLDISEESVRKAKRVNKGEPRVRIRQVGVKK